MHAAVYHFLTLTHDEPAQPAPVFYLGTNAPHWLPRLDVPMMFSYAVLRHYQSKTRRLPRALAAWCNDSSAYHYLTTLGEFPHPTREYAADCARWSREVG